MQLVKSPYLALVPTQTSESIYIDVARNKTGPLNRFLGTWLEELTSPRPLPGMYSSTRGTRGCGGRSPAFPFT